MARRTPDSFTKVHYVPTIATVTAPTVAEIAAGTELTPFLTPAGIDLPEEGTDADTSDLSSARDKSIPATVGGQLTAEFYRDDAADDAWTALPRETAGYLVEAPFGGSGTDRAIVASDTVDVYPIRVSQRSQSRKTRGEAIRFTSVFSLTGDPSFSATVAA